jgi:NAD(P)-dependent dehydrogenase (short-subunit alcohol dehydrogenase family)
VSVVVITGSTKGIGRGLAQAFAAAGHAVVVSGRSQAEVDTAVATLPGAAGTVCDVTDPVQVQALWDFAMGRCGRVDIWINNAGFAITHKWTVDLSLAELRAMSEVNLFGGIHGTQVALAGMQQQGGGWIYTVLGGGSDGRQRDRFGGYGMTKIALRYYTEAMIRETRQGPVRIGTILPGILLSEGFLREARQLDPGAWPKLSRQLDMIADRVADVAPWLAARVLEGGKHGRTIRWLTNGKITGRMLSGMLGKKRGVVPETL